MLSLAALVVAKVLTPLYKRGQAYLNEAFLKLMGEKTPTS